MSINGTQSTAAASAGVAKPKILASRRASAEAGDLGWLTRLARLVPGCRALGIAERGVEPELAPEDGEPADWVAPEDCTVWLPRTDEAEPGLAAVSVPLGEDGAQHLCAAVHASRRDSAHCVLARLAEVLASDTSIARLLRRGHPELTLLGRALDGLDQPAFLFSRTGVPVMANAAGHRAFDGCPSWLYAHLAEPEADLSRAAEVTAIDVGGLPLLLVAPRPDGPDAALFWREQYDLSPALAKVAGLLAAGRSDREIADRTGLTYNSVRTYVRRIYGRLNVGSRAELARLAYGGRTAVS